MKPIFQERPKKEAKVILQEGWPLVWGSLTWKWKGKCFRTRGVVSHHSGLSAGGFTVHTSADSLFVCLFFNCHWVCSHHENKGRKIFLYPHFLPKHPIFIWCPNQIKRERKGEKMDAFFPCFEMLLLQDLYIWDCMSWQWVSYALYTHLRLHRDKHGHQDTWIHVLSANPSTNLSTFFLFFPHKK